MTTDPEIHPEELLAEYAEGALGPEDRARVEAHIATCERCSDEVAMASRALASLAALPDLEAPAGLSLAVRRRARTTPGTSLSWRVVASVGAAAVLLAGGYVVIQSLGEGTRERARLTEEAGGAGAGEDAPAAPEGAPLEGEAADSEQARTGDLPRYSRAPTNYAQADLVVLARSLRDEARSVLDRGLARSATSFYAAFDPSTLPRDLREVYRCVVAEVPPEQLIVPFTILEAEFEDEPAYIASFLQGPAPDQPYDRLVMWVVGRDDCRLRSLASQRL
jgi:hypothetical protein